MVDVQTATAATATIPIASSLPRLRRSIIAGYIISLEDGARWANKIWDYSPLPADLETSPTVLGVIDEDFRKQGGLAVHYNILDVDDQETTTRYIVTTQEKQGRWFNYWPYTNGRELVRDPNLALKEGDADRVISERLKERGEWVFRY